KPATDRQPQTATNHFPPMRYLAIDPGDKRTGLAVGDDITKIATPYKVINAKPGEQLLAEQHRAVEQIGPDALIVGLPLNMDGTAGEPAEKAEQLARALGEKSHLPVHLVDERQTSQRACQQMSNTGLTHKQKKNRRDALAAANILRRFLQG